jgi:hypothetical protein
MSELLEQQFAIWFIGIGATSVTVVLMWLIYWVYKAKLLEREERRLMIERGMAPPAPAPVGWPAVKVREQELQYEERRLLIEKGLTPEVIESGLKLGNAEGTSFLDAFLPTKTQPQPHDYLRKGLRALAVGLGLGGAYIVFNTSGIDASADTRNWFLFFGVLSPAVTLFGLANVLYYRMTKSGTGATSERGQVR